MLRSRRQEPIEKCKVQATSHKLMVVERGSIYMKILPVFAWKGRSPRFPGWCLQRTVRTVDDERFRSPIGGTSFSELNHEFVVTE